MDSVTNFVDKTTQNGYGGDNQSINVRMDSSFNQWTGQHNDTCGYVNQIRILRKPMKYYVNRVWAPAPTNEEQFSTFTPVGNQKAYGVSSNVTFPLIGNPTSMGNKRFLSYAQPLNTTPDLGANAINVSDIDVNSNQLNFGIGELTNTRDNPRQQTSAVDYNRWDFVDPKLVQNPDHIIFANGVIPRGGIDTRGQLRNYAQLNQC
jgi:hypothetical protein